MKKKIAFIISCVICSIIVSVNLSYGADTRYTNADNNNTVITIPSNEGTNLITVVHDDTKVEKLIIPKEISSILSDDYYETDFWLLQNYSSMTPNCPNLSEVIVSEQNTTYKAIDGVIYTKDMKQLVYCPPGKTGKLDIPEGVEKIGFMAFQECAKLTSISLPSTISSVSEGAFGGNKKLTSLKVSEDNPYLMSKNNVLFYKKGEQLVAYAGGKKNKSYSIPDGVKIIAPAAFQGCTNLKEIKFCKKLTHIANEAFRDCINLEKVQLQEGIQEIAAGAFMNCSSLKEMNFPEGIRGIYYDVFKGCNRLLDISIPSSIHYLYCDLSDVENRTIRCYSPFISSISGRWLITNNKNDINNINVLAYENSSLDLWYKENIPSKKITYFESSYIIFDEAVAVADTVAKGSGKPDTSWYSIGKKIFRISNPDQLAGLAMLVWDGNNFKDITIELTEDLDLSAYSNWVSIGGEVGYSIKAFAGTFEGANHCIYNLKINDPSSLSQGLFGRNNGIIRNLKMQNSQVFSNTAVGLLAGINDGTIQNCEINGKATGNEYIGGIAGRNHGSISDCISGVEIKGITSVGGIAGFISGNITDCKAKGVVNGNYHTGGIVGYAYEGEIKDCNNYAIINGDTSVGGILGSIYFDTKCSKSKNHASVNGCNRVGGIIGEFGFDGTVNECVNNGNVNGTYYVGGVAGYLAVGELSNSKNYGEVNGYYSVGGVLGILSYVSYNYERTFRCYNHGKISGIYYLDELIGKDLNRFGLPELYWD